MPRRRRDRKGGSWSAVRVRALAAFRVPGL